MSARVIRGGISSAMHLLVLEMPGGATSRVVLRRHVRPDLNEEEPGMAAREARTLRCVESLPIPTPRLLGLDATGADAGAPSVIMSRLGGKVDWWPSDMERWLSRFAEILPAIHEAPPPDPGVVPDFFPYAPARYEAPEWATDGRLWERAFEVFLAPPPAARAVFVHRDFHPGNVLWSRNRVSGLVDWQAACMGPATVDVGHCRANLFRYGLDVADRFTSLWEAVSGGTYDPWSEIVSIVGVMEAFGKLPGRERTEMEVALARAVSKVS